MPGRESHLEITVSTVVSILVKPRCYTFGPAQPISSQLAFPPQIQIDWKLVDSTRYPGPHPPTHHLLFTLFPVIFVSRFIAPPCYSLLTLTHPILGSAHPTTVFTSFPNTHIYLDIHCRCSSTGTRFPNCIPYVIAHIHTDLSTLSPCYKVNLCFFITFITPKPSVELGEPVVPRGRLYDCN